MLLSVTRLVAQNSYRDSLENILPDIQGEKRIDVLNRLGEIYIEIDRNTSQKYADEALELSKEIDYEKGFVQANYVYSHLDGNQERILFYTKRNLDVIAKEGNPTVTTQALLDLGVAYRDFGVLDSARISLDKGIAMAKKHELPKLVALGYSKLGALYYRQGNYEEALVALYKCLEIVEQHPNQSLQVNSMRRLGDVYRKLEQLEKAIEQYKNALKILENDSEEVYMKAILYGSIAAVYSIESRFSEALEYHKKSLGVFEKLGSKRNTAAALHNIGYLYKEQGKLDEALAYYLKSLKLIKEIKNKYGLAVSYEAIGGIYKLRKEYKKTISYFENSLEMARVIGDSAQIESVLLNLSEVYEKTGDTQQALTYYKNAVAIRDSLMGNESRRQIAELETKYELTQKEQEIKLLNKDQKLSDQQRNLLIGLLVSIFLISALIYSRQRLKVRKSQELLAKEREVDQLKSQFFTNVSHEFRTPLTLILGVNQQIQEQFPDSKLQELLQLSSKNVTHLQQLITQLLDISKLEAGKMELDLEAIDLLAYINVLTASFDSLAQQNEVKLSFKSELTRLPLKVDQDKMGKIVNNLISNAIKFTETGGSIDVFLEKTAHKFVLKVKDSGVGIASEDIPLLFNRFYQSDSTTSKAYEGTGIGLALVKELVDLHGGQINVQSELGKGTVFTVLIPLKPFQINLETDNLVSLTSSERIDTSPYTYEPREEEGNTAKILIVEDNPDLHQFIKQYLSTYQVFSAYDGVEGLAMAMDKAPDLIISDVMMPKMDGYDFCAAIKQNMQTSHIPIILLTAKAGQEAKYQGLETGADDYLIKPFDTKELTFKIRNIIASRKQLGLRFAEATAFPTMEISHNSADKEFMDKALFALEDNYRDEQFNVDRFASEIGVSRTLLNSKLQALIGQSTNKFIQSFRLQKAEELLKKTDMQVAEIAFQVGFSSSSYFVKCFRAKFGLTPKQFAEKNT